MSAVYPAPAAAVHLAVGSHRMLWAANCTRLAAAIVGPVDTGAGVAVGSYWDALEAAQCNVRWGHLAGGNVGPVDKSAGAVQS